MLFINAKCNRCSSLIKCALKQVCVETNKTHEVMSSSLETDDRDYVTEDDLTTGNVLIWVKNKKRLTVRVAEKGNHN